jgi:uncharacterized membrane protein YdjX (TVP38/TMEM64 family)
VNKPFFKILILIFFLASAIGFFRFTETGRQITPLNVRDYFQDQDPFAARLLYVGFYILGTVLLLPGVLLSFAGAVLLGPWEGTLYTWIGATIGATLAFILAKSLGRDFVQHLLKGKWQAFDERIRQHGFTGLLIIRLVPLFPFNGVNFGCGLTAIKWRDYLLATAIGIVPATFVYQYLFANLGTTVLQEGFHWEYLWDPTLLGALGLFFLFVVMGKWLGKRLRSSTKK